MIFYTDKLPTGVAGRAIGPIILIDRAYRGDQGLIEHERTHVLQWMRTAIPCVLASALLIWLSRDVAPVVEALAWTTLPLGFVAWNVRYTVSRAYRLRAEIEAYTVQMQHPDRRGKYMSADVAARRLASQIYCLGISVEEARTYFPGKLA